MKKTLYFSAAVGAVLLFLFAALFLHPIGARAGNGQPAGMEVKIDNFTFGPDTITVPVNTTVTWVNKDDVPHVVASNDGLFKSRALDTDQTFAFTFTKAGTYPYYCSIHPKMVAKVVVQ